MANLGLNKQQMEWASQHDWWIRSSSEGYVVVRDWDNAGNEVAAYFSSFAKLRAWAGY